MIEQRYREFDVALENIFKKARAEGHTIPCKRGCDACCYEAVIVMHMEIAPMVRQLRSLSKAMVEDIRARLAQWFEGMKVAGLSPSGEPDVPAYFRAHLPCPLLDLQTHECRIYATRPLACRGHHIVDDTPAVCASRGDGTGVPWLAIHETLVMPAMATLMEDTAKGLHGDGHVVLMVGLLPSMLRLVWPLVEDKTRSIDQWINTISSR